MRSLYSSRLHYRICGGSEVYGSSAVSTTLHVAQTGRDPKIFSYERPHEVPFSLAYLLSRAGLRVLFSSSGHRHLTALQRWLALRRFCLPTGGLDYVDDESQAAEQAAARRRPRKHRNRRARVLPKPRPCSGSCKALCGNTASPEAWRACSRVKLLYGGSAKPSPLLTD